MTGQLKLFKTSHYRTQKTVFYDPVDESVEVCTKLVRDMTEAEHAACSALTLPVGKMRTTLERCARLAETKPLSLIHI